LNLLDQLFVVELTQIEFGFIAHECTNPADRQN